MLKRITVKRAPRFAVGNHYLNTIKNSRGGTRL